MVNNTIIKQAEMELLQLINSKIQLGVPHAVLGLLLENMLLKIENETNSILRLEKEKAVVTEHNILDEEKRDE